MKLGEILSKRKEKIKELRDSTTKRDVALEFQGHRQNLPIYTVSVDFPKYRLDNGRTKSAQATYLADHPELSSDFFSRDLEDIAAQKVQHEILKTMLGDDPKKNLLRYFRE